MSKKNPSRFWRGSLKTGFLISTPKSLLRISLQFKSKFTGKRLKQTQRGKLCKKPKKRSKMKTKTQFLNGLWSRKKAKKQRKTKLKRSISSRLESSKLISWLSLELQRTKLCSKHLRRLSGFQSCQTHRISNKLFATITKFLTPGLLIFTTKMGRSMTFRAQAGRDWWKTIWRWHLQKISLRTNEKTCGQSLK